MAENNSEPTITQMVDHYLDLGQISYREYQRLAQAMLADEQIDDAERECIDRLFKAVRSGRLRIVN